MKCKQCGRTLRPGEKTCKNCAQKPAATAAAQGNILFAAGPLPIFAASLIAAFFGQAQMYNGRPGIAAGLVLFVISGLLFVIAEPRTGAAMR